MSPNTPTSGDSSSSQCQEGFKDTTIQGVPGAAEPCPATPNDPQLLTEALKQPIMEQESEEKPQKLVAPDGGWGWVVATGVFLITVVVPMMQTSFGILFAYQLEEWDSSSTAVAIIFNSYRIVWTLTGVVVGTLTDLFGFRWVAMTGTLLSAFCVTLSAFATSPELLFLFFSLGCGLGTRLSCVGFLILAKYFDKRRGMANTILSAGFSLGTFISPIFIRHLQVKYGYRGATMVLGAFFLHSVVGSSLFQPVVWHMKYPKGSYTPSGPEGVAFLVPLNEDEGKKAALASGAAPDVEMNIKNVEMTKISQQQIYRRRLESQSSNTSETSHHMSSESKTKSTVDIASLASSIRTLAREEFPSANKDNTSVPKKIKSRISKLWASILRVLRAIVKYLSILRKPTAVLIAVGTMLIVNTQANFTLMVPFAIQAAGHSLQTAAWCVSIAGACNLAMKLIVSPLSDYPWFSMKVIYILGIIAMTMSVAAFPFQTEVAWQATVMGVWGLSTGLYHGINNLYMTRIVGTPNLTAMFGARNLMIALGFIIIGPLVGVVRDASNSYAVSMWVLSGFMFLSLILWLLLPTAVAYVQRKEDRQAQMKPSVA